MSAREEPRAERRAPAAGAGEPRALRSPAPIELVVVVVPARNEEQRVVGCLAAIDSAAQRWGGPVLTVVGADACTDATASVISALRPAAMTTTVLEGTWRRASATRRAGVERALALASDHRDAGRIWIANTDADCTVDHDWITRQVASANRGVDVVAGVVALDPEDAPLALQASFAAHYQRVAIARPHVHAANLGIRASVYRKIGGWRSSTAIGEEHHLVRAAARGGATIGWADDLVVRTSARTTGRVRGGFASVLGRLERGDVAVADSA
jgi:hypothetical protein